jgi:iron complex transport system substrate-binding protein
MRALVGFLAAGAVLASAAWTAAVPAPPVAEGSLGTSTISAGGFPKTVVDPLGVRATLRAPPQRIVSIELSGDELLLGLVDPARLAGVTPYVDDPATSPSQPLAPASAARVSEEDPEALLSLRPDLVVTAGYTHAEVIVLLEAAGVPVLGTGAHGSLDDVLGAITTLGQAVGEPARADAWVATLRARMQAVQSRPAPAQPPRVLLWESGFTYAAGTLQDDLLRRAGGIDVATEAGQRGPVAITEEAAVAMAPDLVIVPVDALTPRWHDATLVGDAPVWRAVKAVREGRVYGVPRAWIGSVSHHAVRALEAMADILRDPGP